MRAKKACLITAGVLAAGAVAAPLAWAADGVTAPSPCSFVAVGDSAEESSVVSDDNPVNLVPQAPVGGNNTLENVHCSTYGNDNNQGNLVGNRYHLPGIVDGEFPPAP